MKKSFIFVSILVIFLAGCASKTSNIQENLKQISLSDIQKEENKSFIPEIEKDIDKTIIELKTSQLNADTCSLYINSRTNYLLNNGESEYLSSKYELDNISKRAYTIAKKLFEIRLLMREQLKMFSKKKNIDKGCISSFRKAFRYTRFLEEFITELGVARYSNRQKANPYDFSMKTFQFYLNPKYEKFTLKSGDILVMRPSNYVSAAIARIGDDDGQFSHGALVYIDKNEKVFIVEALISKGLVITPYEIWRKKNHNARIVQFRYQDTNKAREVAKKFFEARKDNFNNQSVLYDFHMDESKHNELFCTEVIYETYKNENIPTYKTSFLNFKNHDFLKKLTIKVDKAFAPSDIEVEPKFELVSEWRNYDTTTLTRLQDAVLSSVLRWMSADGYQLKGNFSSALKTRIGYVGRQYFGLFADKIPENMPYGFLQTLVELGNVNDILESHLIKQNQAHIKRYGYPMTYKKMIIELEKVKHNKELSKLFSSI